MRLLKETGVLVSGKVGDKTRLLINPMARQDFASAFKHGHLPELPSQDRLEKSVSMLLKSLRKRLAKSKTKTKPALAPVAVPPQTTSSSVATLPEPPTAPPQTQEATPMSAASPVPAPAVSAGAAAKSVPRQRFVAYLPPGAARDVWIFLYVRVTSPEDFGVRIAVPNGRIPDGIECSLAEFDHWLKVYVQAGIIECLNESGDNRTFSFKIHPDEIHTVEIKERRSTKVARIWIDVANRARREIRPEQLTSARLRNQLAAWVEGNFPGLLGLTASQKLMGYRPDAIRKDTNWGIFFKDPNQDVYLPCLPGLEPFEFVPTDFVARRCKRKGKGIKLMAEPAPEPVIESTPVSEPAPAREPEPVPTVESAPAPIASTLLIENVRAWIDKERQHLNEAERLLMALTIRERKRAALSAELEVLDAQIAADRARLDELGFRDRKEG